MAFMTLCGLPVSMELEWPFRASTSGSDLYSLHARVWLEGTEGLHAQVAVNLTQVMMKQAFASLEPAHTESASVNAVRSNVDEKQLEFVKSGKRVPVPLSSRYYDFKNKRMTFHRATEEQLTAFLRRKVYWLGHKLGAGEVRLAEPADLEYLGATSEQMLGLAKSTLMDAGLIEMARGWAKPLEKLIAQGEAIEAETRAELEALEAKHEYERG
ncbi:MAG: hypothetical protein M3O85_02245 [Acidobacteriota bacterium]|nr:hypothetical protein [Acidobacteriota bacterium]